MHTHTLPNFLAHAHSFWSVGSESGCPGFLLLEIIVSMWGNSIILSHACPMSRIDVWSSQSSDPLDVQVSKYTAAMINAGILQPPGACGVYG